MKINYLPNNTRSWSANLSKYSASSSEYSFIASQYATQHFMEDATMMISLLNSQKFNIQRFIILYCLYLFIISLFGIYYILSLFHSINNLVRVYCFYYNVFVKSFPHKSFIFFKKFWCWLNFLLYSAIALLLLYFL